VDLLCAPRLLYCCACGRDCEALNEGGGRLVRSIGRPELTVPGRAVVVGRCVPPVPGRSMVDGR
jgi:hypothetical protein